MAFGFIFIKVLLFAMLTCGLDVDPTLFVTQNLFAGLAVPTPTFPNSSALNTSTSATPTILDRIQL